MKMKEDELNIEELEKEYLELRELGLNEPRQEEIRNIIYCFQEGSKQTLKNADKFIIGELYREQMIDTEIYDLIVRRWKEFKEKELGLENENKRRRI